LTHLLSFQEKVKDQRKRFGIPQDGFKGNTGIDDFIEKVQEHVLQKSAKQQWQKAIRELLTFYKLPRGFQKCLEIYIFSDQIIERHLAICDLDFFGLENGGIGCSISLDEMPSKKEWEALYLRCGQMLEINAIVFKQPIAKRVQNNIARDIRIIQLSTEKKKPHMIRGDVGVAEALHGDRIVRRVKIAKDIDVIHKVRKQAKADIAAWFGKKERSDF